LQEILSFFSPHFTPLNYGWVGPGFGQNSGYNQSKNKGQNRGRFEWLQAKILPQNNSQMIPQYIHNKRKKKTTHNREGRRGPKIPYALYIYMSQLGIKKICYS